MESSEAVDVAVFDGVARDLLDFALFNPMTSRVKALDSLRIPLTSLDVHGVPFRAAVAVLPLRPEKSEALPIEEVTLSGTVALVSDEVLFRGRLTGEFVSECARCLEEARVGLDVEVCWFFTDEPAGESAGDREGAAEIEVGLDDPEPPGRIVGGEIDLAPMIWEELVLAAPLKYVCREDCLGLCPKCGINRNRAACDCGPMVEEETGTRKSFVQLKDLLPDYKHEPSED